jgi:hypothetical protein
MIHSRQPEDFKALHSRAARKNILNRIVENVAERKHTRDIGRRHDDRERRLRGFRVRNKIPIVDPSVTPLRFNRFRIVSLGEFHHRDQSSETRRRLQIANAPLCHRFRLSIGEGSHAPEINPHSTLAL